MSADNVADKTLEKTTEKGLIGLENLGDVPMLVQVHLGSKRMSLAEILELRLGSLVDVPRSAGENLEIRANGRLIAMGEVVMIQDIVGIRVTEIVES